MFDRFFRSKPATTDVPRPAPAIPNSAGDTATVRRIVAKLEAMPTEQARLIASAAYTLARAANADLDISDEETAAMHLMRERGLERPPGCVTADYAIRMRRPTPTDRPVELRARPVETQDDRVVVDAEMLVDGIITATCRGTFVAVGPDHPAFDRW